MTYPCGQGVAPASLSPSLASVKAPPMSGTFGPTSSGLSPSAALQSSLENKLRARMAGYGSPEYALIWKHWDMRSGPPICALRASGRRISGKDCTGWPHEGWKSPKATEGMGRYSQFRGKKYPGLWQQAEAAGWPTPTKGNAEGSQIGKGASSTGKRPDGSKATVSLNQVAQTSGWPTPNTPSGGPNVKPTAKHTGRMDLEGAVTLVGWATPTTRDHKDGASTLENVPINALLGRQASLSTVQTEKRGALNPAFSLWLMGFPTEWASCGARVTRLSRRSRRSSSKPS